MSDKPVRKHTVIVKASSVGAGVAAQLAEQVGLSEIGYMLYPDKGTARVWGFAERDDKTARSRWVRLLKQTGFTVEPAPWEKRERKQGKRKAKPDKRGAADAMRRIHNASND